MKEASSKPPESETMHALKSPAPAALGVELGLLLGAALEPPVPGGWAHPPRVRARALSTAGASRRDFFT
ncbi:hypothetical protein GCM10009841_11380 [Microlunatus panaciterrae]